MVNVCRERERIIERLSVSRLRQRGQSDFSRGEQQRGLGAILADLGHCRGRMGKLS